MSSNISGRFVSLDHIYSDLTPSEEKALIQCKPESKVCPICKKELPPNANLSFHMMLHPWTDKPYSCDHCLYVFMTREDLSEHCKEVHPSSRKFICAICSKEFTNIRTLNKHKPTHALVLPFSCAYCDKGFPEYGYWRQHEVAHKTARFKCDDCEVRFTTIKFFNDHRESESCKTKVLECCEQIFSTRMDYVNHCVECHRFQKKDEFECTFCGRLYAFRCLLNVHVKQCRLRKDKPLHTRNRKPTKIPSAYITKPTVPMEVPKSCLTPTIEQTESGPRRVYNCDLCERTFFTKSWLINHRQRHLEPSYSKFVCPTCNKKFRSYSALYYHKQRIHLKIRRFNCPHCDKSFYCGQSLKDHVTSHTGEQPYVCNYCPRRFRNRSSKVEHHRVHTGERPYQCRYCEQRFKRRDAKAAHERRHTGEKPFKCEICDRCFAQDSTWRGHEKKHMPPFACTVCKQMFDSKQTLVAHKKDHSVYVPEVDETLPSNEQEVHHQEIQWEHQPVEMTTDAEGNVFIQYKPD